MAGRQLSVSTQAEKILELSKEEIERYSRQILLYGRHGQEKLKAAHVCVIGAGGLGATLLPLLAAAGTGQITLFDPDTVERTNLGRQLIFREADLGHKKAECAADFLRNLNPHIRVNAAVRAFSAADAGIFDEADLVCEGSDSLPSKFLANDLALSRQKPVIIGALGKSQGHSMLIAGRENACYRCVFDELKPGDLPTCASEGILSTFPSLVAAQMAHTAVSFLLGDAAPGLWIFEKSHCRKVGIKKSPDCNHE